MYAKKGQIAVFVIIAVMIVLGILLVIFVGGGSYDQASFEGSNEIDRELRDCFNQRSIDATRLAGLQGGYVNLPENHIRNGDSKITYGLRNGKNVLIRKNDMEKEIASYLSIAMPFCLNDNLIVANTELEIASVDVKIRNDFVMIENDIIVGVVKGEESYTLEETYEVSLNVNLGNMHNVANEIVNRHVSDNEFVDVSYLASLNYDVNFVTLEDKVIYTIIDEDNKLQEVPYSFVFVV